MSRLNKLYLIIWVSMLVVSCGNKPKHDPDKTYFDNASEYNQYISNQFDEVNRLWNASLTVMDDSALIYKQLDSLSQASQQSLFNMHKLADFKGDTGYKHAAAEYFKYMYTTANGSYREAVEIGLMDEMSDSLYFKFMEISNQIGADKEHLIVNLKKAQLTFIQSTHK